MEREGWREGGMEGGIGVIFRGTSFSIRVRVRVRVRVIFMGLAFPHLVHVGGS